MFKVPEPSELYVTSWHLSDFALVILLICLQELITLREPSGNIRGSMEDRALRTNTFAHKTSPTIIVNIPDGIRLLKMYNTQKSHGSGHIHQEQE